MAKMYYKKKQTSISLAEDQFPITLGYTTVSFEEKRHIYKGNNSS